MVEKPLSKADREILLNLARKTIRAVAKGERPEELKPDCYSDSLREQGASFVTLTKRGQLRGCVGALEPYQPLVVDVQEHAIAAASQDYRFSPVKTDELDEINIEISRLTKPKALFYENPNELLTLIRPGIDGVVLKDGFRKATFLPQVWEKIGDPIEFLSHLCIKMGVPMDTWRKKKLEVFAYQVEEFHE